ncbi:MAG: hypothetical protein ACC618_00460 [Patescibacteria group bacterium]
MAISPESATETQAIAENEKNLGLTTRESRYAMRNILASLPKDKLDEYIDTQTSDLEPVQREGARRYLRGVASNTRLPGFKQNKPSRK